ncbi:MAG: hypothetical protein WC715_03615 [Patescibacteria group bacterium]|jgi:hypothetical protein
MTEAKDKKILKDLEKEAKKALGAVKSIKARLAAADLKFGRAMLKRDIRNIKTARQIIKSRVK